jgi:hypothetical protein
MTRWAASATVSVFAFVIAGADAAAQAARPFPAAGTVPATAPDTLPAGFHADSNTVQPSASTVWAVPFTKQAVFVDFKATSTVEARTAAVSLVHGTVVGGTHGYYMLRVPDDGSGAGIKAAVDELDALPAVNFASGDFGNYIVVATGPVPGPAGRGNGFTIRGVVVNASNKPVSAVIHFADGSPDIHTGKLGEFHLVRSSRDTVRLTVDAPHYFDEYPLIHPGRDSVIRVVLTSLVKLPPIRCCEDGPPIESAGKDVATSPPSRAPAAP